MRVIEINLEPLEEDEPRTPREYMTKLFGENFEHLAKLYVETGDTDVTKEAITEEVVEKFARAIRLTYAGCRPADARQSALLMLNDPEVMKSMMPKIAKNLEGAAQMLKTEAGDSSAFEKHVDRLRKEHKLTRTEAMQRAREEHPEDFAAYQEA